MIWWLCVAPWNGICCELSINYQTISLSVLFMVIIFFPSIFSTSAILLLLVLHQLRRRRKTKRKKKTESETAAEGMGFWSVIRQLGVPVARNAFHLQADSKLHHLPLFSDFLSQHLPQNSKAAQLTWFWSNKHGSTIRCHQYSHLVCVLILLGTLIHDSQRLSYTCAHAHMHTHAHTHTH